LTTDFHLGAETYIQIHEDRENCLALFSFPKTTFLHARVEKKKSMTEYGC